MIKKAGLACTECGSRNYTLNVSGNAKEKRIEVKKFCKTCGKHTLHKETR
ncbi:50S ribosomal protein L33 [Lactococcus hircilactis]|uniref:Large ribosomal subunit protein bL33 n=1 Tax=Lactococcus hircilactis TaxID=1494462 RepID=A0A7X1Z9N0_9LACT|nr:50S ribosomal protein L33 [Lactococcus hircilactis]MQW40409.1 50S ribosomal protein L33 [Lactococcus hircilactis]